MKKYKLRKTKHLSEYRRKRIDEARRLEGEELLELYKVEYMSMWKPNT